MEIKLKSGELITVDASYVYEIDGEVRVVKVTEEKTQVPRLFKFIFGDTIVQRKTIYKINSKEIVYIKD